MKTIAFLSQKGGSGKTTLAVHTAVAAEEAGFKVVIVDTDPQQSSTAWSGQREQASPFVATVSALELPSVLDAARNENMTLAVVDTAPHTAPNAVKIAELADLIVIPCRPSAFDIAAVASTVAIVKAAGAKAVFVLSACPFRAPEVAETRAILEAHGFPVSPFEITERRAFARAVSSGRAVTEFESAGKAAQETRDLMNWLMEKCK